MLEFVLPCVVGCYMLMFGFKLPHAMTFTFSFLSCRFVHGLRLWHLGSGINTVLIPLYDKYLFPVYVPLPSNVYNYENDVIVWQPSVYKITYSSNFGNRWIGETFSLPIKAYHFILKVIQSNPFTIYNKYVPL